MTLKDLLLGGSGGLFALLTILQISPIKSLSLKASCIASAKSATPAFPLKNEWR